MKKMLFLLLLFPVLLISFTCEKKTTVEPQIDKEERGKGLFINASDLRPAGLDTLYINEGDTVKLVATTILLEKHQYNWISGDDKLLKILPDSEVDSIAYAVAVGENGSVTSLTLDDTANEALKTIPVKIVKFWADPLYFSYMGEYEGHHYYMSKQKVVWTQAADLCEEAGGHLVTITSSDENIFLLNQRDPVINNSWIGLTFLHGNDKLTHWITGEELSFQNFVGAKPNDPGIFAEFYFFMQQDGKWENWHEISYYFILEME